MIPKIIKTFCIVACIAFLLNGLVGFLYGYGIFRFASPVLFWGIIFIYFSFLRRKYWSWLLVLIFSLAFALLNPIMFLISPVSEADFGGITIAVNVINAVESITCAVIFICMLMPQAKVWFGNLMTPEDAKNTNFFDGIFLEITYRYNLWDILWANLFFTLRSVTVQISLVVLLFLDVIFIYDSEGTLMIKIISFFILLIPELLCMVFLSINLLAISIIVNEIRYGKGKASIKTSVFARGIVSETPSKKRIIKWTAIKNVRQNKNYIILYISDLAVILIPKRAFKNNGLADEFFNFSFNAWEAAKNAAKIQKKDAIKTGGI